MIRQTGGKMKTDIFLVCFILAVGNGLSIPSEEIKTREVIKNVVKLQAKNERKSDGEIAVDFDRFSGGICLLDEHCAFFIVGNTTVQISYCDYSEGTRLEVWNILIKFFLSGILPGFDGECRLLVWVWVSLAVVFLLLLLLILAITVCCWRQFNNITALLARGFSAAKCWCKNYRTIWSQSSLYSK